MLQDLPLWQQPPEPPPPQAQRATRTAHRAKETSIEARTSIRRDKPLLRHVVLAYLRGRGPEGATDDEMQEHIPMNPSTQRPRRGELAEKGLIVESGERRPTRTGRRADVWVAVEFRQPSQVTDAAPSAAPR